MLFDDWQVARLQLQVLNALQRVGKGMPSSTQTEICDAQQQLQADLVDITTVSCAFLPCFFLCVCVCVCVAFKKKRSF